jgi:catechol 2,3-dioxygenase-like lactoylglutathione lyase family enzyme
MKRLHVHVAVADLSRSIRFYSVLFGTGPSLQKPDYAKWMLEDPRVNFAISTRGKSPGLDHLGIQVESREELAEIAGRLQAADTGTQEQADTRCCYARSAKTWSADPQGIAWESFYTYGENTSYGTARQQDSVQMSPGKPVLENNGACCVQPGA